jgi:hypothetical protein
MKLNKKVVDLISEGFKANTLKNLTESQIDKLYERVVKKEPKEQTTKLVQTKVTTGEPGKPVQVNPDPTKPKITAMAQGNRTIVKQETSEGKKKKVNPWAVCRSQQNKVGKKKMTDDEVESCIKKLKKEKTMKENLFIEKKILNLVEKYTTPKMSKKEFLSILENEETKTKEPKVKPGTKTPPKEKPHDPFKPAPHKQPKPKAKKEVDEQSPATTKPPKEAPTKPGTKSPTREKPHDPFKPAPHKQPKPKAGKGKGLPEMLKFKSLGIKFKK